MLLLTKIKAWLIGIGAAILAVLGAFLYGKVSGKSEGESEVKADDIEATQKAVNNDLNLRQTIDEQVSSLPPSAVTVPSPLKLQEVSDAQPIATADPSSAAGQLRDWMSKS
jgi:hypothetical protein